MDTDRIRRTIGFGIGPLLLITALTVVFHYYQEHYLFHIAVEALTTAVSFGMFIIALNTYRISRNHFFVFLGLAFGFVGLLDLLHALAGYGFVESKLRLESFDQPLWLASRLLESISLIASFCFLRRNVRPTTVLLAYILILVLSAIFVLNADQSLIFEVAGFNIFLLGGAVLLLYKNREQIVRVVYRFMLLALLSAIGCELIQENTTVESNAFMVAHVLNYLSFYFIYKALIEATLQAPYQTLFHDLSAANSNLRNELSGREKAESALKSSERKYRAVVGSLPDFLFRMLSDGTIVEIMPTKQFAAQIFPGDESKNIHDILPDDIAESYVEKAREALADNSVKMLEYRINADGVRCDREARLFSSGEHEVLALVRDVTESHRRQEELRHDFRLAAEVQHSFLPPPVTSGRIRIDTIFEPVSLVSGDLYGYKWKRSGSILAGFLFDIMGHGLATTLKTSALMVLFSQAFESDITLKEKMAWINAESMRYFNDDSFAAAFCFEIDLDSMTITYVAGGITNFLASLDQLSSQIVCEGSLVGVDKDAVYEEKTIQISAGDNFFFITDGLHDLLLPGEDLDLRNFASSVAWLRRLANSEGRRDDCSALCISVN